MTSKEAIEILLETFPDQSREDWLEGRRLGCGGTDSACLLGQMPTNWATPVTLYRDKLHGSKESPNIPMRRGTMLEPLVVELYEEATKHHVYRTNNRIFIHPLYKRSFATLDGLTAAYEKVIIVNECKTAYAFGSERWRGGIPPHVRVQIQKYLGVITDIVNSMFPNEEFKVMADLSCVIDDRYKAYYEIELDRKTASLCFQADMSFFNKHVIPKRPPVPQTFADVKLLYDKSVAGSIMEVDEDFVEVVDIDNQLKFLISEIQGSVLDMKEGRDYTRKYIAQVMGEYEVAQYKGQTVATRIADKNGVRKTLTKKVTA